MTDLLSEIRRMRKETIERERAKETFYDEKGIEIELDWWTDPPSDEGPVPESEFEVSQLLLGMKGKLDHKRKKHGGN